MITPRPGRAGSQTRNLLLRKWVLYRMRYLAIKNSERLKDLNDTKMKQLCMSNFASLFFGTKQNVFCQMTGDEQIFSSHNMSLIGNFKWCKDEAELWLVSYNAFKIEESHNIL